MYPNVFGSCAFVPMGLAVKYPRELLVSLLHHNFGASIDGVLLGHALGWNVRICVVIRSHS